MPENKELAGAHPRFSLILWAQLAASVADESRKACYAQIAVKILLGMTANQISH
jgi:hypothetical protein